MGKVLASLGNRIVDDEFCAKHSGVREFCVHSIDCSVISLWENVQEAVDGVLFSTTLADLLPRFAESDRVAISLDSTR